MPEVVLRCPAAKRLSSFRRFNRVSQIPETGRVSSVKAAGAGGCTARQSCSRSRTDGWCRVPCDDERDDGSISIRRRTAPRVESQKLSTRGLRFLGLRTDSQLKEVSRGRESSFGGAMTADSRGVPACRRRFFLRYRHVLRRGYLECSQAAAIPRSRRRFFPTWSFRAEASQRD
jgi:hypothetical protein